MPNSSDDRVSWKSRRNRTFAIIALFALTFVLGLAALLYGNDARTAERLLAGSVTTAHDAELTTVSRRLDSRYGSWSDVPVNEVVAIVDLPEGPVGRNLLWPMLHGDDSAESAALQAAYDGTFEVLYDPADTRRVVTRVDAERLAGKSAMGLWIAAGVAGLVLWRVARTQPRR